MIKMHCNTSLDFLVERCCVTITYVDSDFAGKRVGGHNTPLFWWHWPGDDESILPIVTSMIDTPILSSLNAAITCLPDLSLKMRELWERQEEPNEDRGLHASNVTPLFDNNSAAGRVKTAMTLDNPKHCWIVYFGQQADGTSGAQTPMCGGSSYLPLDDVLPPPPNDMIDGMGEESDDYAQTQHPNRRCFLMTKTGLQTFEWKLEMRIIRQQRYLEVNWYHALGHFAVYEQSVVADEVVAWLCEDNHILNPPTAGSLANRKLTSSCPAAN